MHATLEKSYHIFIIIPLEQEEAGDPAEVVQVLEQQRQELHEDYQQHENFYLPSPIFDSIHPN